MHTACTMVKHSLLHLPGRLVTMCRARPGTPFLTVQCRCQFLALMPHWDLPGTKLRLWLLNHMGGAHLIQMFDLPDEVLAVA